MWSHTRGVRIVWTNKSLITLKNIREKIRENLTRRTIALLLDLCKLAGGVSSVAIEHGAVALGDLAGVVQHDHLGGEVGNSGGWLVLGVGSYVASPGKVIV